MFNSVARFSTITVMMLGIPVAPAQAQTTCTASETSVFYGNGVLTDRVGAFISLMDLEDALSTSMATEDYNKLDFRLSYNSTGGTIADVFEAAIQDITTDITEIFRMIAGVAPMTEAMRDRLVNAAAAIDQAALLSTMDLGTHVANYSSSILEGRKVVLVSHSQGNFFANQAYALLTPQERLSFGIVSVANPDSFVGGNGPHTTLFEDLVIAAVRAVKTAIGGLLPLPANVTNFLTFTDLTGHGFSESYLGGSNSRSSILSDFALVLASLSDPSGTGTAGVITATLTWGAQPDVDLHAFEPNGTHVYYAHSFGPSGFLDVDDVTSFGPEHYTVGCSTLEEGTYRIAVNYYSGSAPEVANVLIEAGLTVRGFSLFLPVALGGSGNATPVPVGSVVVTRDAAGEFTLEIH